MTDKLCPFCRKDHRILVPCVHSNGTSAEDLRDDLDAALSALQFASERLIAAAPSGRDYYLVPGAITIALSQHNIRLTHLEVVRNELIEMRDHVQAVMGFKQAHKVTR